MKHYDFTKHILTRSMHFASPIVRFAETSWTEILAQIAKEGGGWGGGEGGCKW